jgi:hypothetical protein
MVQVEGELEIPRALEAAGLEEMELTGMVVYG